MKYYAIKQNSDDKILVIASETAIIVANVQIEGAIKGTTKPIEVFLVPGLPPIPTEIAYVEPLDQLPVRYSKN